MRVEDQSGTTMRTGAKREKRRGRRTETENPVPKIAPTCFTSSARGTGAETGPGRKNWRQQQLLPSPSPSPSSSTASSFLVHFDADRRPPSVKQWRTIDQTWTLVIGVVEISNRHFFISGSIGFISSDDISLSYVGKKNNSSSW